MSLPKGVGQTFSFPMCDLNQELVSGLALTATVQKDGGTPTATKTAVPEIGKTGLYRLTLTSAERLADETVAVVTGGGFGAIVTDYPGADVLTPLAVVDTVVDGIAAKTTNLPASPAAVGSNMGTVASVTGAVGSVTAGVALAANQDVRNVAGTLPAVALAASQPNYAPATAIALTAAPAAVAAAVMDAALDGHEVAGSVGAALASGICKWVESADGTCVTLYRADGTTPIGTFPWDEASRTRGRLT